MPMQICFALKKRYEGETLTNASFFFPLCSISHAQSICCRGRQLNIGFPVPVASPKAAILTEDYFFMFPCLTMSVIKWTLYRKCSSVNIQVIQQLVINVLES